MPGSGAFTIEIGPLENADRRSIVPLPPTGNAGAVDFNPVILSLAASFATNGIKNVFVTIFRPPAPPEFAIVNFAEPGRVVVPIAVTPAHQAALVQTTGLDFTDQLTALVEYGTP
jgi:hypothetical protein